MKKCILINLITIILTIGCSDNIQHHPQPNQQILIKKEPDKSIEHDNNIGLQFGPQLKFQPRYNFSTGEFEFLPSLSFGPHYNF